jgi:hypothetical protein
MLIGWVSKILKYLFHEQSIGSKMNKLSLKKKEKKDHNKKNYSSLYLQCSNRNYDKDKTPINFST